MEACSIRHTDEEVRKYHWDIQSVRVPVSLKGKQYELVSLIRELAVIYNEGRSDGDFVIDKIADPQFV